MKLTKERGKWSNNTSNAAAQVCLMMIWVSWWFHLTSLCLCAHGSRLDASLHYIMLNWNVHMG